VDPANLIMLVQQQRHMRMSGPDKLRAEITAPQVAQRADAVRGILRALK
jgi:transcription-repair coupling factor (superfamily II helicase)